jgi:hypothetical protein
MKATKTLTGMLAGALLVATGCSRDANKPMPHQYVGGNSVVVSTIDGRRWVAQDLDEKLQGFEVISPEGTGSSYPKFMSPEYAKKIGKEFDGTMIREITTGMDAAILNQKWGQQDLAYLMALEKYEQSQGKK